LELTLTREPSADGCTIGKLSVDGVFECFALEDVVRDGPKVAHETAIPAGRYRVIINRSERFGRMLPRLVAVPGFDGILIHPGNTAADTSGCILVGQGRGLKSIIGSQLALAALQPQIAGAIARGDNVYITIQNAGAL
jgi:hypothetical protein